MIIGKGCFAAIVDIQSYLAAKPKKERNIHAQTAKQKVCVRACACVRVCVCLFERHRKVGKGTDKHNFFK